MTDRVALARLSAVSITALMAAGPALAEDSSIEELRRMLEMQQQQIEQQRQLMEQQSRELERLRREIEGREQRPPDPAIAGDAAKPEERRERRTADRLPPPPAPVEPPPAPASTGDWLAAGRPDFNVGRPAKGGPPEAYVAPAQAVTAGDFPGSFQIPGTDVSFKVGGYAKLDVIYDADDIASEDLFVTSAIAVDGGRDGRTRLHARQSRINLDARSPSPVGDVRVFLEGDFFGAGGNQNISNSTSFRLRHAFGEFGDFFGLGTLTAGQTWGTFMDVSALPETIDFEGPNAESFIRQGLLRWTQPLGAGLSLALSIENPEGDIFNDGELNLDQVPDGVVRARWDRDWGHLQSGVVLRQIRLDDGAGTEKEEFGYGVNASGRLNVGRYFETPFLIHEKDNLVFQGQYGDGIGRYIVDLGGLGGDAAFDPATGTLETLEAWGAYGAYQHWWTDTLRSTAGYGFVQLNAEDFQPADTFRSSQYVVTNLIWSPIPRVDFGLEYLYGQRKNRDNNRGGANRVQAGFLFRF